MHFKYRVLHVNNITTQKTLVYIILDTQYIEVSLYGGQKDQKIEPMHGL